MAKTKRARARSRSTSSVQNGSPTTPPVIRSQGFSRASAQTRVLDARPDTLDFRDRMFEPTLIEVQTERPLDEYRKMKVPILDQGTEGACTGFGLATVVHYLLRTRDVIRDDAEISPRMLYDMARRYDEWPGEKYSGSSARGAMKGWHKHGVCSRSHWIYDRKLEKQDGKLFTKRYEDALRRPLGAYFRVNHKDLIAMHAAITEVGILYATSQVHEGWQNVGTDGVIQWTPESQIIGGHAFAIVAYDEKGFWIQNSWADDWGKDGYAQISYDDWLANGSDIWVARLGAPVILRARESVSRSVGVASQGSRGYVFCDLRPHIISLGNNGQLKTDADVNSEAMNLRTVMLAVSEAKSLGLVILDLGDTPSASTRRISLTSWFRLRRAVEHTPTVFVALARQSNARTCASLVIECARAKASWSGSLGVSRLLRTTEFHARSTHRRMQCTPVFTATAI